ncbi:MAG: LysR family transcriptional regulator [Roseibium sp.]|uniref:LysR family transcriptional regulator n=1 Tax=Roseibium sp. TaxID=1936156 RepID=UPI00261CF62C|nr:LysR family transcriptional regulator [Roseibium sp.]MCV0429453.1 LysR family transcriptional regulator [Roseibium sp.]
MKLLRNTLLETFVAVVECGGFSDAQHRLGITQSAISCRIRDLEITLGYRVCERGRGGFCLTERGKIAYEKARDVLRRVRDFDSELTELRDNISGDLRIGIVDTVSSLPGFPMVPAMRKFLSRKNEVQLEIVVASPTDLTQGLITGLLHVAIAPFKNQVAELSYTELCTEVHSLYCGREHPLFDAPAESVTAEVLQRYPLCRRAYDPGTAALASTSSSSPVVANMEAMAMMIESGHYLGALPDHFAQAWVQKGMFKELTHDELRWTSTFYIAVRPSQAQRRAVELFLQDTMSVMHEV